MKLDRDSAATRNNRRRCLPRLVALEDRKLLSGVGSELAHAASSVHGPVLNNGTHAAEIRVVTNPVIRGQRAAIVAARTIRFPGGSVTINRHGTHVIFPGGSVARGSLRGESAFPRWFCHRWIRPHGRQVPRRINRSLNRCTTALSRPVAVIGIRDLHRVVRVSRLRVQVLIVEAVLLVMEELDRGIGHRSDADLRTIGGRSCSLRSGSASRRDRRARTGEGRTDKSLLPIPNGIPAA